MKVVVAVDSFKGSMSSREAGNAVKEGVLRVYPDAKVVVRAWRTEEKALLRLSWRAGRRKS